METPHFSVGGRSYYLTEYLAPHAKQYTNKSLFSLINSVSGFSHSLHFTNLSMYCPTFRLSLSLETFVLRINLLPSNCPDVASSLRINF